MSAPAPQQPKILRIGIIQGKKIIEERLIRAGETVSIGESTKNTFVLPPTTLQSKRHSLFIHKGSRYFLNFTDEMDVKIALSNSFGFGGHNACLLVKKLED